MGRTYVLRESVGPESEAQTWLPRTVWGSAHGVCGESRRCGLWWCGSSGTSVAECRPVCACGRRVQWLPPWYAWSCRGTARGASAAWCSATRAPLVRRCGPNTDTVLACASSSTHPPLCGCGLARLGFTDHSTAGHGSLPCPERPWAWPRSQVWPRARAGSGQREQRRVETRRGEASGGTTHNPWARVLSLHALCGAPASAPHITARTTLHSALSPDSAPPTRRRTSAAVRPATTHAPTLRTYTIHAGSLVRYRRACLALSPPPKPALPPRPSKPWALWQSRSRTGAPRRARRPAAGSHDTAACA